MLITAVQQILSIAAALAITLGVIVALLQLRSQRRVQQFETVSRIYSDFGQAEFLTHFQRVRTWKYRSYAAFRKRNSEDDYISLQVVGVLFENMGLLYKRGLAPLDLIDDLLSGPIIQAWEKSAPIWQGFRAEYNQPQWAEWFEYLYEALVQRLRSLEKARSTPGTSKA